MLTKEQEIREHKNHMRFIRYLAIITIILFWSMAYFLIIEYDVYVGVILACFFSLVMIYSIIWSYSCPEWCTAEEWIRSIKNKGEI